MNNTTDELLADECDCIRLSYRIYCQVLALSYLLSLPLAFSLDHYILFRRCLTYSLLFLYVYFSSRKKIQKMHLLKFKGREVHLHLLTKKNKLKTKENPTKRIFSFACCCFIGMSPSCVDANKLCKTDFMVQ